MADFYVAASAALALTAIGAMMLAQRSRQQATTDTQSEPIMEHIPDFAALGIIDPNLIREELRRGPSLDFHIGPEQTGSPLCDS